MNRPSPLRALSCLVALGLLVIVLAEIGIGRQDWLLRAVPRTELSLLAFGLNEKVTARNPDARIVVLGTSRARGAFLPTVMESELGLERGQVLNLGIGGVHIQEATWLYEQARTITSRARTLVLQVDPFSFSRARPVTDRQCEWLSWRDRVTLGGLRAAESIACGLFRLDHRRPLLRAWLTTWLADRRAPLDLDQYGRPALVYIGADHDPKNFSPTTFAYWLEYFYRDFTWSALYERHLLDLVRLARADGLEVIVVHLPLAPDYLEALLALPSQPYQQFRERLPVVLKGLAHVQFWEQPMELGLRLRDYRDWGHLNTPGAEQFSKAFAHWMQGSKS